MSCLLSLTLVARAGCQQRPRQICRRFNLEAGTLRFRLLKHGLMRLHGLDKACPLAIGRTGDRDSLEVSKPTMREIELIECALPIARESSLSSRRRNKVTGPLAPLTIIAGDSQVRRDLFDLVDSLSNPSAGKEDRDDWSDES